MNKQTYLGNDIYCEVRRDDGALVLTTVENDQVTNTIALNSVNLRALDVFRKHLQHLQHKKFGR